MALEKELYSTEITSESKKELQKFSKWMEKSHGDWPTIIGGWAVWSYYDQGFGSRDIDLVLPNNNWIEQIMKKEYFVMSEVKPYQFEGEFFGEIHYGKPIKHKNEQDDIIFFDLISAETPREDNESLNVVVDWNWVFDSQKKKPIGNDSFINVPELELLITLKMIGGLSRIRTLSRAQDPTYWRSKIWKDCYDVANLVYHIKPKKEKLKEYFIKTNLTKELTEEFLEAYDNRQDVLDETNSDISVIEKFLIMK